MKKENQVILAIAVGVAFFVLGVFIAHPLPFFLSVVAHLYGVIKVEDIKAELDS